MAARLLGIAESDQVPAYVAVQAINSALDRAGVIEQKQLDVTIGLKPFESVIEGAIVESGRRSDFRAAVGRPDPSELPAPTRPGGEDSGVRVLGETFDGNLVIESHPPGSTQPDDEHQAGDVAGGDVEKSRRDSIGNVLTPVRLPHGAYLPAEDALEQANAANRNYRYGLGKQ